MLKELVLAMKLTRLLSPAAALLLVEALDALSAFIRALIPADSDPD